MFNSALSRIYPEINLNTSNTIAGSYKLIAGVISFDLIDQSKLYFSDKEPKPFTLKKKLFDSNSKSFAEIVHSAVFLIINDPRPT